jgi:hypothetical protein
VHIRLVEGRVQAHLLVILECPIHKIGYSPMGIRACTRWNWGNIRSTRWELGTTGADVPGNDTTVYVNSGFWNEVAHEVTVAPATDKEG